MKTCRELAVDGVRAGAGAGTLAVAVAGAVDHLSVSTVTHASVSCLAWDMLAPSLSHCRVPSSTAVCCHGMCVCVRVRVRMMQHFCGSHTRLTHHRQAYYQLFALIIMVAPARATSSSPASLCCLPSAVFLPLISLSLSSSVDDKSIFY